MKTAGLRIRIEPELRDEFVEACRAEDLTAAQVLRAFMRRYVAQHYQDMQEELFPEPVQNASMKGLGRKGI